MSSNITELLAAILSAKYGEEVRGSIHDAIEMCYADGKAGVNDLEARRLIEAVAAVNESQEADIEALTARVEELEQGEGGGGSEESTSIDIDTLIFDHGQVNQVQVNNNQQVTRHVTFAKPFTEVPTVALTWGKQTGGASAYARVTACILYETLSKTGFDFFISNTSGAVRSPTVTWCAWQPTTKTIDLDITIPDAQGMSEAEVREITGPIAASVDAIKTGYDGTVYTTPGEAVRTQINDLHVLIGDTPGTAIQASSVAYNDSNVAAELTNVNGRLGDLKEDLNGEESARINADSTLQNAINSEKTRAEAEEARIESLFTQPVEEAVSDWLNEHPEATTTVEDGSITEAKFAPNALNYINRYVQTKTGTTTGGDLQSIEVGVEQSGALAAVQNVAVGSRNLRNNVSGKKNVAIGHDNLVDNTTGEKNSAIGYHSNFRNTTGHDNASLGAESLDDNTTGVYNTGVGAYAVQRNSKGNYNVGVGGQALRGGENTTFDENTTMLGNSAVGYCALQENRTGNYNSAVGYQALKSNISGTNNIAIGTNAIKDNTSSSNNIAIGAYAYGTSTDTNGNHIAIGAQALYAHTSGSGCIAIGKESQRNNATGAQNVSIGFQALQKNANGEKNTIVGYNAGQSGTTGSNNTALGHNALNANSGDGNVAIGSAASASNTTGEKNTSIGYGALGLNTTGSNNIAIGYASNRPDSPYDNTITIGNSLNPTASNQCLVGKSDQADGLYLCGKHIIFNPDGTVSWE